MKTFKTFMAVMAMVMVSGAAKAQSAMVPFSSMDDDIECVDNSMDFQQNAIVGTYTCDRFIPSAIAGKMHYERQTMYVYADGTFVVKDGVSRKAHVVNRGFWQANGNGYYFQGSNSNFHLTFAGNTLQGTKASEVWIRK